MAVILGKCWHKKPFNPRLRFWGADLDKQSAIDTLCTKENGERMTIQELSKFFIVEVHDDDPTRIHIFGYYEADNPYPNIGPGNLLELKCDGSHGIMRCSNSLHYYKDPNSKDKDKFIENGHRYHIIEGGTYKPTTSNKFVELMLKVCNVTVNGDRLGAANNNKFKPSLASTLWQDGKIVKEGENRHVSGYWRHLKLN
jgi:hypothetical protein